MQAGRNVDDLEETVGLSHVPRVTVDLGTPPGEIGLSPKQEGGTRARQLHVFTPARADRTTWIAGAEVRCRSGEVVNPCARTAEHPLEPARTLGQGLPGRCEHVGHSRVPEVCEIRQ